MPVDVTQIVLRALENHTWQSVGVCGRTTCSGDDSSHIYQASDFPGGHEQHQAQEVVKALTSAGLSTNLLGDAKRQYESTAKEER